MRSVVGDCFYFRERRTRFVVCTLILASCNDLKRRGEREKGGRKKNNERDGNQRAIYEPGLILLFERGGEKNSIRFVIAQKWSCAWVATRDNNLTG